MNRTCELLKKSFYEDEWTTTSSTIRETDDGSIALWIGNGPLFFTGYDNHIHIPILLRGYMWYHYKRGQNIIATRKYLEPKEAANERANRTPDDHD
jgi:hypothetical protein